MRTKTALFLCLLIALTSCNNDDNSTQNPDNGLTLYKTVKFSPTEEAYNAQSEGSTKNVKYYENNLVVTDTLYNHNGEAEAWGIHEYTVNTHFSTYKYLNPSELYSTEDTYDNNGRIIQQKKTFYQNGAISSAEMKTFTYTNNNVTLALFNLQNSNTPYDTFEYLLNSDGLIYHFTGGGDYQWQINYDSQKKPLSYGTSYGEEMEPWTTNATYYDNIAMPSNQLKTTAQINNSILINGMENIFLECNYHCKSINSSISLEKTFDESGNVLHCRQTSPYVQIYPSAETYYYYNQ
jgi:hypothetical protein